MLFLTAAPVDAAVNYFVTVNTSSVNGTAGFLDFQFNPGNATTQQATAVISNFVGGTPGVPTTSGNVTGSLPATVTLCSSGGAGCTTNSALNELFQGFTYGNSFSFLLTLSGPAISTPNGTATAGSTFGVGLYDITQNPILTNQGATTGFAGTVDITLLGTTVPTAFPSDPANDPTVVTFALVNVPTFSKVFGATTVMKGFSTSLSFTITNPAGGSALHNVSFTDTLPGGLAVATPNGLVGTCSGTPPTAVAGSGVISLAGATIAAGTSCTFSVNVTGTSFGTQVNTTSTLTTTEGVTGNPATASITVVFVAATPVMSPLALGGFALLLMGLGSLLARKAQTI